MESGITVDDVRLTGIKTLLNEDFSNGIPNNWTEEYSTGNSTAPWVYRGTNTTPNNTVGSQGPMLEHLHLFNLQLLIMVF